MKSWSPWRTKFYTIIATGLEVDFVATDFAGGCRLIRVAADISVPDTFSC
jgi:hypothetical protein